jgi:hypothetical protein
MIVWARLFPSLKKAQDRRMDPSLVYAGSLHLRYEFVPGATLIAGFMTGSRPASLDDQARLDAGRPGLLLPTETALASEAAYSGEAAVRLAYSRIETSLTYAVTYLAHPISMTTTSLGGNGLSDDAGRSLCRSVSRPTQRKLGTAPIPLRRAFDSTCFRTCICWAA